jgi:hypothetical protein
MSALKFFWPLEARNAGTILGWVHGDGNVIVVATVVEDKIQKVTLRVLKMTEPSYRSKRSTGFDRKHVEWTRRIRKMAGTSGRLSK